MVGDHKQIDTHRVICKEGCHTPGKTSLKEILMGSFFMILKSIYIINRLDLSSSSYTGTQITRAQTLHSCGLMLIEHLISWLGASLGVSDFKWRKATFLQDFSSENLK